MRKILMLPVFIYAMGCKTNVDPQESLMYIDKNNLSETTQLFVPLAEVAWDYIGDANTRNLVYKEVEQQFDGDYNVLFAKMVEKSKLTSGRSVGSESIQKAENALQAFATVDDGRAVFPQIYIPFYEELKAAGKIGIQEPVLIFRDGAPTKDERYQGYSFQNGALTDKGMISEDFASKNEVWVISANERVDTNGRVKRDFDSSNTSGKLNGGQPGQVKGVTIFGKDNLKEDWISGGAEVSLSARNCWDGVDPDNNFPFFDNEGRESLMDAVVDVKRSDAKDNTWKWANNVFFMDDWDTNPNFINRPYAVYNLFEFDPWPASQHELDFYGLAADYRSYESPWYIGQVYRGNVNAYNYNDGKIYFKLYEY